jgi:hypothetical protein
MSQKMLSGIFTLTQVSYYETNINLFSELK